MIFSKFRSQHPDDKPTRWDYLELVLLLSLLALAIGFIFFMKSQYNHLFLQFI
jgi:hypothetical protein